MYIYQLFCLVVACLAPGPSGKVTVCCKLDEFRVKPPIITLKNLSKSYRSDSQLLPVLKHISLDIKEGEFVAIMGPSGSGKSTLLNVLGILDGFDSGTYCLAGRSVAELNTTQAAEIRNQMFGFVFQSFNLLPFLSALENVALPLTYRKMTLAERERRARQFLSYVDLAERASHRPAQLSGGQCQRVAIARALVTEPQVIFADEPTGALDSATSREIMSLLSKLHKEGASVVMVTHADDVAQSANRVVFVRDGQVVV